MPQDNKIKFAPQGVTWVWAKITTREAIVLQKMRKFAFGMFTVYKENGIPIRTESKRSEMVEDDTELTLECDLEKGVMK